MEQLEQIKKRARELFKTIRAKSEPFHPSMIYLPLLLGWLYIMVKGGLLLYPSTEGFLENYRFVTPDSFDWIANGVRFLSDDISYRQPLFPLLIKVLNSVRAIFLLPLLNQVVLLALTVLIYLTVEKFSKNRIVAMLVAAMVFINYQLQSFSNFILSELYFLLLVAFANYFALSKRYKLMFLSLGLSALVQSFSYFLIPLYLLFYLMDLAQVSTISQLKELPSKAVDLLREYRTHVISALLLILPSLLWFMFRLVKFGDPLYTQIAQFDLLGFNTLFINFYVVSLLALYGLAFPFLLVSYLFIKKVENIRYYLLLNLSLLVTVIFWVFLYQASEKRFMLYLLPFFYPVLGYHLADISTRFRKLLLPLLVLLLAYPTFLSNSNFFNGVEVPISFSRSILFSTETKINIAGKQQLDLGFPVQSSERVQKFPLYAQLFELNHERQKLKEGRSTPNAYKRFETTEQSYGVVESEQFCEEIRKGVSLYVLNGITLIKYDLTRDQYFTLRGCQ